VMIGSSSNGSYHRDHAKRTHFHGEVGETWGSEARRPSWQKTWSRVDSWLSNPGFYFFWVSNPSFGLVCSKKRTVVTRRSIPRNVSPLRDVFLRCFGGDNWEVL